MESALPKSPPVEDGSTFAPAENSWGKRLKVLLGIVVSVGCLYYSLRSVIHQPEQRAQFVGAIRNANYQFLLPMTVLLLVFYWMKAVRWRWLLSPLGDFRPLRDLFPPILIGFAWNNLLPAHLGEFMRMHVFSRETGVPRAAALSSIVTERVFDIIAIVCLFAVGNLLHAPTSSQPTEAVTPSESPAAAAPNAVSAARQQSLIAAAAAGVLIVGSLIFVVWTAPVLRLIHWTLRTCRIPERLSGRVLELLTTAGQGLSALRNPRTMIAVIGISLIKWLFNGALIYLALVAYKVAVTPSEAFILLGVVALGVTIPCTPGYFGVIQVCFTAVLGNGPAVVAASFFYQLAQYIPVTALGLYFYYRAEAAVPKTVA